MKTITSMDDEIMSTHYGLTSSSNYDGMIKFGLVDENNVINAIIMTKNFHQKCTYNTKLNQCLTIYKTNMTIQFKLQTKYSKIFLHN